jgi:hypothetical protein
LPRLQRLRLVRSCMGGARRKTGVPAASRRGRNEEMPDGGRSRRRRLPRGHGGDLHRMPGEARARRRRAAVAGWPVRTFFNIREASRSLVQCALLNLRRIEARESARSEDRVCTPGYRAYISRPRKMRPRGGGSCTIERTQDRGPPSPHDPGRREGESPGPAAAPERETTPNCLRTHRVPRGRL